MIWKARQFEFRFPGRALVMGIVNVTPDSFSDGGQFLDPEAAVAHGFQLVEEGADILDVGGESTRPGAAEVSEGEELRRVLPVIERLAPKVKIPISIDTRKAAVARAALERGASIVNDIAAGCDNRGMWEILREFGAGYVAMHMKGCPETMQKNPAYGDVVTEVGEFFEEKMRKLGEFGVDGEQIVLDVGIGFGKTIAHNLELLRSLGSFKRYGRPLLLGASRKSFIARVTGSEEVAGRLPGSLACACWGVAAGANIVRVHDVLATCKAIRMTEAIQAETE
jgi:dihydropteroate synthase